MRKLQEEKEDSEVGVSPGNIKKGFPIKGKKGEELPIHPRPRTPTQQKWERSEKGGKEVCHSWAGFKGEKSQEWRSGKGSNSASYLVLIGKGTE